MKLSGHEVLITGAGTGMGLEATRQEMRTNYFSAIRLAGPPVPVLQLHSVSGSEQAAARPEAARPDHPPGVRP